MDWIWFVWQSYELDTLVVLFGNLVIGCSGSSHGSIIETERPWIKMKFHRFWECFTFEVFFFFSSSYQMKFLLILQRFLSFYCCGRRVNVIQIVGMLNWDRHGRRAERFAGECNIQSDTLSWPHVYNLIVVVAAGVCLFVWIDVVRVGGSSFNWTRSLISHSTRTRWTRVGTSPCQLHGKWIQQRLPFSLSKISTKAQGKCISLERTKCPAFSAILYCKPAHQSPSNFASLWGKTPARISPSVTTLPLSIWSTCHSARSIVCRNIVH